MLLVTNVFGWHRNTLAEIFSTVFKVSLVLGVACLGALSPPKPVINMMSDTWRKKVPWGSSLLSAAANQAQEEGLRRPWYRLLANFNETLTLYILVASVTFLKEPCRIETHQNGTTKLFFFGFFMREASRITLSQNMKVRTYNSLFKHCNWKIKTRRGWQYHST